MRDADLHSIEAERPGRIPFVLIPGLAMSGFYFLPLARALAASELVRVVELPRFGRSTGPRGALPMREHAAWLRDWMEVRNIRTCHLVGHSMGCQVTAHLAAEHAERVRTLTLIGPTVDAHARRRTTQILRLVRDFTEESFPIVFRALADVLRAGVARTWRTSTEMLADPLEAQLARITAPTLLLRGANDWIASERWLQTAAKFLSAGRCMTLPVGAHCVQFSAAEQTAAAILAWISLHNAGSNSQSFRASAFRVGDLS